MNNRVKFLGVIFGHRTSLTQDENKGNYLFCIGGTKFETNEKRKGMDSDRDQ